MRRSDWNGRISTALIAMSPENFAYVPGFIVPSQPSCAGGTPPW